VIFDVRCISCGRLIGKSRNARSKAAYCLDPICPTLPTLGDNDTRDSVITTMNAIGWNKTHLADVFGLARQRVIQITQARGLHGTRGAPHGAADDRGNS